jgi:hypothetical protein
MLIKKVIILCAFLSLAACAQIPKDHAQNRVQLAPDISFELPEWTVPERAVEAVQLLKARYADKTFSLQVRLSLSSEKLSLLALDSLGRRAFMLTWSKSGIHSERANWLPDNVKAENVLGDIVMAFWPEQSLQTGTKGTDAVWSFTPTQRRLFKAEVPIMTITTSTGWDGHLKILNHVRSYEIDIRSTELKE